MEIAHCESLINEAWDNRDFIKPDHAMYGAVKEAVFYTLNALDHGQLRVAYRSSQTDSPSWHVNQWVKKAILLSFTLYPMRLVEGNASFVGEQNTGKWYDKIPGKFWSWDETMFKTAGFRAVPGAIVRHSAYIAKNVVLMPSFVNIGAFVDEGTMVDTWATIGSCAQIGKHCHISGGAGIGGVLEPLQANPVIIEDNCFIGARSEVAEGVIVGEGSVLSMGVFIGASTRIVDRETGTIYQGKVPPYSVVVPGSLSNRTTDDKNIHTYAAIIVKKVDAQTRSKTSINELLRDIA